MYVLSCLSQQLFMQTYDCHCEVTVICPVICDQRCCWHACTYCLVYMQVDMQIKYACTLDIKRMQASSKTGQIHRKYCTTTVNSLAREYLKHTHDLQETAITIHGHSTLHDIAGFTINTHCIIMQSEHMHDRPLVTNQKYSVIITWAPQCSLHTSQKIW